MLKENRLKRWLVVLVSLIVMGYAKGDVYASDSIVIIKQPMAVSGKAGSPLSIKVEATGNGLRYQWQYSPENDSEWYTYPGQTEASLNAAFYDDWNGMKFRCIITDEGGNEVISDECVVSIIEKPVITEQPESVSGKAGSPLSIKVEATGKGLRYQWQYSPENDSEWYTYPGQTEASLNAAFYDDWNGMKFRCIITDEGGNEVISDECVVSIIEKPVITEQPESVSGKAGSPLSIKVEATGKGLRYQWQYSPENDSEWYIYPGQTEASLNAAFYDDWNGMKFRCIITDEGGNEVISDECVVSIIEKPVITEQPESVSGKAGSPLSIKVEATGKGLRYQWQYSPANDSEWYIYPEQTEASLNAAFYDDWNGMKFRCVITDMYGNEIISDLSIVNIIFNEDWELPII